VPDVVSVGPCRRRAAADASAVADGQGASLRDRHHAARAADVQDLAAPGRHDAVDTGVAGELSCRGRRDRTHVTELSSRGLRVTHECAERHDDADVRPLPAISREIAVVAERPAGEIGERVGAALTGRALVLVTARCRQRRDRGEQLLATDHVQPALDPHAGTVGASAELHVPGLEGTAFTVLDHIGPNAVDEVRHLGMSWFFVVLALIVRTPSVVMTMSWLVLMPLTFLTNIFVDPATMPGWLQAVVAVNPVAILVTAVRGIMAGTANIEAILWSLLAPAIVTAVLGPVAMVLYGRKK
jgi:hypothetical protein